MQPTRPFDRVRVPHGCRHSTLHSRAQLKRPPSAHGCEWPRWCGSEHTHRTAQHAARHTVRRVAHRVLPGYSRGTVVAPLAAALSAPSHCACRTAAGRERPQAQHHAAARGAAGGPVPCYVQYPAVPYRVNTTVLGATREWRNKPEASRPMGGHRLPCPYKLAATCPPSLPHPQARQTCRIGIRHADQLAR